jgi:FtsH-binding integral membrane protein
MRRRWRARLRWFSSAGGLGGLRVYSPGVVCGIVMSVWSYWQRNVDAPAWLIAGLMLVPYYGLAGFWMARKRSVEVGALVGAVTAVLGFVIVSLTMIVYAAGTQPWLEPVAYLLFSLTFLIPAAFVGGSCGLVGGTLAHVNIVRSPWHRRSY